MNDQELDELLEHWTAPPVRASLRSGVRDNFLRLRKKPDSLTVLLRWLRALIPESRTIILAGSTVGTIAVLLIGMQAFPQVPRFFTPDKVPYTVLSRFTRYAEDGSSSIERYTTSYIQNRNEVTLSTIVPGHPLASHVHTVANLVENLALHLAITFSSKGEQEARDSRSAVVKSGCTFRPIVARETILGYATVAVQVGSEDHQRMTRWMAPDLGCFALRIRVERQLADGTFHLVTEKQALKVNVLQ